MQSVAQLRKWLAWSAVALLAITTISYYIARMQVAPKLHVLPGNWASTFSRPAKDSRSPSPRVAAPSSPSAPPTPSSSRRVAKRDLKNVHIVVYGKSHDRYDQIYGKEFTYDPASGEVKGVGEVHIDLQGYAEGPPSRTRRRPDELQESHPHRDQDLSFNQKTGQAHTDGVVRVQTLQASGTATGAYYDANTNQLQLKSDVHFATNGDNAADIVGSSATIQKDPRQATLFNAAIYQPDRTLTANKLTMLFEDDNTRAACAGRGQRQHRSRAARPSSTFRVRAATSIWARRTP